MSGPEGNILSMRAEVLKAISRVRELHGLGERTCMQYRHVPDSDIEGTLPCPRCGGTLHYTVSSYNGYTAGHCETDGCLVWAE